MGGRANLPARLWSLLIIIFLLEMGVHIDAKDHRDLLTGLMAVGNFRSGNFVLLKMQLVLKQDLSSILFFKLGNCIYLNIPICWGWQAALGLSISKSFSTFAAGKQLASATVKKAVGGGREKRATDSKVK